MPGVLAGGSTVALDGKSMTFRTFILNGPYMSWHGFLGFLLDFRVARAPSTRTRSGRNYHRTFLRPNSNNSKQLQLQQQPTTIGGDPPVLMKYAVCLFLEASRSASPALMLPKHAGFYQEIAAGHERDSWLAVLDWDNDISGMEWNVHAGINFMQFVDCLAVRLTG
jgi:hypothetical protein